MFSEETIGLASNVTFGLTVVIIALYLLLNAKDAAVQLVAFFIIALPLMNSPYLPGQVFGIRGLSPVNFFTALACLAIFAKLVFSGLLYGYIIRFLSLPLLLCILVFIFSAGMTYFADSSHLYYQGPSGIIGFDYGRIDFLLYECIRPLQIMLVGFIIMVACDVKDSKRAIQRALLIAPIVLSLIALLFSLDAGLGSYRASREMLGVRMGMHGNGFGALSVYFLVAAITMREHEWPTMRYAAIAFALLGVVLSYSRIAFLATLLMLALLYFKLPAKEKVAVAGLVVVVVLAFSAQLISRIQYGLSEGSTGFDLNTVSAGRVTDIWLPGLKQFMERPLFGYGIGMLVDSPTVGRWIPHNAYLALLLNTGLAGILSIANLLYWSIRYCRKNNDETLYLLLSMMILTLTGHTFYPDTTNYVVWVSYGMLIHAKYKAVPPVETAEDATNLGAAWYRRKQLSR